MSAKSTRNRASGGGGVAVLAALAALVLTGPAVACNLTVETPDAVRIEYNPFAVGLSSGPLNLEFRNLAATACELRLVLIDDIGDPAPTISLGGVVVEFRPREASGLFRRDAEPGAFLLGVAESGGARAELDVAVLHGAVVEAGEHLADLRLSVENAEGQPLLPPIPIHVVLSSTPRAQINIAGSAGAYGSGSSVEVIDFGEAATGITRQAFVQVRANAESTLTVRSEHRGVMQHLEAAEGGTVISYSLELDGDQVDLSEVWSRRVDPPRTLDGVSLPMNFTLGEVRGQMSGRYEDLITIDITPR